MLQELSQRATNYFGELNEGQAFDPAIIMVIAELILQAIEAFSTYCATDDPDEGLEIAQSPTRFQTRWYKRQIRKKMGLRDYLQYGDKVYKSLYLTAKDMTAKDMEEAYRSL